MLTGAFGRDQHQLKKFTIGSTQLFEKSCTKNFLNYQSGLVVLELSSDRVYEYSRPVSVANDSFIRNDLKNGCFIDNIYRSAVPVDASDYRQVGPGAARPLSAI